MDCRSVAITGALVGALAGCGRKSAPPAPAADADVRVASWRADLAALERELPARHVEPFFHRPEAEWRADLAALDADLPGLTDDEITVRAAQLVASLGDGHTRLAVPAADKYPLRLFWFDDGLFVLATPAEEGWAIGNEIVTIGGRPAADALALLATAAPHDNDSQRRNEAPSALLQPVLVRGLGLADPGGTVTIGVRAGAGTRPLVLAATATPPRWRPLLVTPLARSHPKRTYWSAPLPDHALFVQYNACAESDPPFAQFVADLAGTIERDKIARVVVDLRNNGGGNSDLFAPFLAMLAQHPKLRAAVLIGRATFSSAVLNALELERAGAVLVGEVAGGAPSHHGEVKSFELPAHRLTVFYSTKVFTDARHPGSELVPAIPVAVTAADYFAGKDAALTAALAAP